MRTSYSSGGGNGAVGWNEAMNKAASWQGVLRRGSNDWSLILPRYAGISLDHILLDREHAQQDLQRNQPNQDLHVKLVGFCSSTYDYGDEGHNPYEPADWQIASPEQMLNGNSYGAFGPPRAADVWAVGVVTSLLLFNKNHAFLDLINDDLFSAIDLTDAKEYFPLSHEAIRLLASLDRQAGWPEFFDLVNVLDRENHDPT